MKKKKKLEEMNREELFAEKQALDERLASITAAVTGEELPEEEEYDSKTNLIYNFFNFFIGGDNSAKIKNKQTGKPNQPPY